ncbi:MAG: ATP-binding protein [Gammaproteobacteria bacterium]|nr:ATP-binding protein [Gammaproteobacteria bacterium]
MFGFKRKKKATNNPFTPGFGIVPEEFRGRDEEIKYFTGIVGEIGQKLPSKVTDGMVNNRIVVLFAPRGQGKTALLSYLEHHQQDINKSSDADVPVRIINVTATQLGLSDLHAHLMHEGLETEINRESQTNVEGKGTLGNELIGKVEGNVEHIRSTTQTFKGVIQDYEHLFRLATEYGKKPLLLCVDEAHHVADNRLVEFISCGQEAIRDGMPMSIVLAGTPELIDLPSRLKATFLERAKFKSINRLSDDTVYEILRKTFANHGVKIPKDKLDHMTKECQGYPYFSQLYGESVWNHCVSSKRRSSMNSQTWANASKDFQEQRTLMYSRRYRELVSEKLLAQANVIAKLFQTKNELSYDVVSAHLISSGFTNVHEDVEALVRLGYVWTPADAPEKLQKGIPSLLDYVSDRHDQLMHIQNKNKQCSDSLGQRFNSCNL